MNSSENAHICYFVVKSIQLFNIFTFLFSLYLFHIDVGFIPERYYQ